MYDEESEHFILTAGGIFGYLADHLKKYSSILEDYLKQERSGMWDPYTQNIPRPNELDIDRYWGLEVFYPTTFRESLFVATFSHFESVMNELCKKIGIRQQKSFALYSRKERGVTRAYKYLTQEIGLSVSNASWTSVKFLNQLRNLVVHNNSTVEAKDSKHQQIQETAEEWTTIEFSQDGRIKFHSEFNEEALDILVGFFEKLRKDNARYKI